MRILIVGGHGKVAMILAPLLTASGHRVTSLIRNVDHIAEVAATGATPVVADLEQLDVEGLAEQIAGHDAVVWTAGAGGGDPVRTGAIDRDAAIRSMDAAVAAGVRRYLMVSYFGAGPHHGVAPESSFFAYAEAKTAADAHLVASDLDWTIVAPSGLTSEPGTGTVEVGDGLAASQVSRADVARVIVAVLDRPATAGSTIAFNSGSTPIEDAVTGYER